MSYFDYKWLIICFYCLLIQNIEEWFNVLNHIEWIFLLNHYNIIYLEWNRILCACVCREWRRRTKLTLKFETILVIFFSSFRISIFAFVANAEFYCYKHRINITEIPYCNVAMQYFCCNQIISNENSEIIHCWPGK